MGEGQGGKRELRGGRRAEGGAGRGAARPQGQPQGEAVPEGPLHRLGEGDEPAERPDGGLGGELAEAFRGGERERRVVKLRRARRRRGSREAARGAEAVSAPVLSMRRL